jgi:hypothetical protein
MVLHPITQEIAKSFGYPSFSEEERSEQFQADITFSPKTVCLGDLSTYPKNGSVYRDKKGVLQLYWKPKYAEESLQGWYEIPSNEDIEEWVFDSICFTPAGDDEVEPDHPDSWLSLLNLI